MKRGINLLPWREQLREERKNFFILLASLTAISAIFFVIMIHFYVSFQIDQQDEVNQYYNQKIKVLDRKIIEIKNLQQEKKQLLNRMTLIQSLQQTRPEIVTIYNGIVKATPKGVIIDQIKRENYIVTINGIAQSNSEISKMMRNLEGESYFVVPMLNEIKIIDETANFDRSFQLKFLERTQAKINLDDLDEKNEKADKKDKKNNLKNKKNAPKKIDR